MRFINIRLPELRDFNAVVKTSRSKLPWATVGKVIGVCLAAYAVVALFADLGYGKTPGQVIRNAINDTKSPAETFSGQAHLDSDSQLDIEISDGRNWIHLLSNDSGLVHQNNRQQSTLISQAGTVLTRANSPDEFDPKLGRIHGALHVRLESDPNVEHSRFYDLRIISEQAAYQTNVDNSLSAYTNRQVLAADRDQSDPTAPIEPLLETVSSVVITSGGEIYTGFTFSNLTQSAIQVRGGDHIYHGLNRSEDDRLFGFMNIEIPGLETLRIDDHPEASTSTIANPLLQPITDSSSFVASRGGDIIPSLLMSFHRTPEDNLALFWSPTSNNVVSIGAPATELQVGEKYHISTSIIFDVPGSESVDEIVQVTDRNIEVYGRLLLGELNEIVNITPELIRRLPQLEDEIDSCDQFRGGCTDGFCVQGRCVPKEKFLSPEVAAHWTEYYGGQCSSSSNCYAGFCLWDSTGTGCYRDIDRPDVPIVDYRSALAAASGFTTGPIFTLAGGYQMAGLPIPTNRVTSFDFDINGSTVISDRPPLKTARAYAGSAQTNKLIFVLGGLVGRSSDVTDTIEYASLGAGGLPGEWHLAERSLPRPLSEIAVMVYRDSVFVVGGKDAEGNVHSTIWESKLTSSGELGEWRVWSSLSVPRSFANVLERDGEMYIIGGVDDDKNSVRVVERIPLVADSDHGYPRSNIYTFAQIREYSPLVSLDKDNFVIAAGVWGENYSLTLTKLTADNAFKTSAPVQNLNTVEIGRFCANGQIRTGTARMLVEPRVHGTALLANNTVFLFGGASDLHDGSGAIPRVESFKIHETEFSELCVD